MKKLFFTSLVAAFAFMGLSSCNNGDYDANPTAVNNTNNPLNTGNNGGGGGGSSFNWSGTDPMSAKVSGTAWQAATGTYVPSIAGLPPSASGNGGPGNSAIIVNFPDNAAPNTVQNFSSTYSASYSANTTGGNPNDVYAASLGSGGSVKILENDATHVKGLFSFNGKNPAGTSIDITEGYFNITK